MVKFGSWFKGTDVADSENASLLSDIDADPLYGTSDPDVGGVSSHEDEELSPAPMPMRRSPHVPQYLVSRDLRSLSAFTLSDAERALVSDYLTTLATSVSLEGVFLGPVELSAMAEAICRRDSGGYEDFLFLHPWTSSLKFRLRDVIGLAEKLVPAAFSAADRLGVRGDWDASLSNEGYSAKGFSAVFRRTAFKALTDKAWRTSAEIEDIELHNIYRNMVYVLACAGDRESMAQMSALLHDAIAVGSVRVPSLEARYTPLKVAAEGWMRLSLSIKNYGDNPMFAAETFFADRIVDLRFVDDFGISNNLIVPKLSSDTLRIGDDTIQTWRDDRYSTNHFRPSIRRQQVQQQIDPAPQPPPPTNNAVPEASAHAAIRILTQIGMSGSNSRGDDPQEKFAALLTPLPLVASTSGPDLIYEALRKEFPWMTEANRVVALAVAKCGRQKIPYFRLPPMLIVGPPGIGKTRWINRVCELVGVDFHSMSLSGIQNTMSIVGSERGWASARPSFMAYGFLETKIANPILHVDEVDKASPNHAGTDVTEAFLPMLEKETSLAYRDIYLLGDLNLSFSSFIFSANDLAPLSQPFLTRVKVLHVERPSREHIGPIVTRMLSEVVCDLDLEFSEYERLLSKVMASASRIYAESRDLRAVFKMVESEVNSIFWTPPGPRLVD